MKIGVLVVAYNADQTITSVLDRIPAPFRDEVAEILVLDDALVGPHRRRWPRPTASRTPTCR